MLGAFFAFLRLLDYVFYDCVNGIGSETLKLHDMLCRFAASQ